MEVYSRDSPRFEFRDQLLNAGNPLFKLSGTRRYVRREVGIAATDPFQV